MPKSDAFKEDSLPAVVVTHMRRLGEDIRIARERRGISLRERASHIGVAVNTYRKLESGRPVPTTVLFTALWVLGLERRLNDLVSPEKDAKALAKEIERVKQRRKGSGKFLPVKGSKDDLNF